MAPNGYLSVDLAVLPAEMAELLAEVAALPAVSLWRRTNAQPERYWRAAIAVEPLAGMAGPSAELPEEMAEFSAELLAKVAEFAGELLPKEFAG